MLNGEVIWQASDSSLTKELHGCTLTCSRFVGGQKAFKMLEADFLRSLFGHEEPKGVLGRLPLVQEQSPEFFFLDSREGVVHNGQHLKQEHNMLSGTSVTR